MSDNAATWSIASSAVQIAGTILCVFFAWRASNRQQSRDYPVDRSRGLYVAAAVLGTGAAYCFGYFLYVQISAVHPLLFLFSIVALCLAIISVWLFALRSPRPKLVIHSAVYGAGQLSDVSVLRRLALAQRDGLVVPIDNTLIPKQDDPAPGVRKRLKVEYSFGNSPRVIVERKESAPGQLSLLVLPEDSEIEELRKELSKSYGFTIVRNTFTNSPLQIVRNRNFTNEVVELDGKSFRDCKFTHTKLMYHGTAPTEIIGNSVLDGTAIIVTDNPALDIFGKLHRLVTSAPNAEIRDGDGPPYRKQPIQGMGNYPVPELRLKVLSLCSELEVFLGAHGKEPPLGERLPGESDNDFMARHRASFAPLMQWRARFIGDYRQKFLESIPKLRDEIRSRAAIDDAFLNGAIEKAASDPNANVQMVKLLIGKLWDVAARIYV